MKAFTQTENKVKILLVEDNPSDIRLASLALKGSDLSYELSILSNGEAAVDYLEKSGPYAEVPRPDIVFLDLNLPFKNGIEILREMRQNRALKNIPVVVLTTSSSPEDTRDAYDAGADLYITKPMDLGQFTFLFQYVSRIFKDRKTFLRDTPPPEIPSNE